jgi:hypothetical protein
MFSRNLANHLGDPSSRYRGIRDDRFCMGLKGRSGDSEFHTIHIDKLVPNRRFFSLIYKFTCHPEQSEGSVCVFRVVI